MFIFNWLLIQGKIIRNSVKQNMREFVLRDVWHTLIILLGLALLYFLLIVMFRFVDRRGMASFDFAFILLSFSLLIFLPLLVYSAIVCCLSFLFEKEESYFYFSFPVNKLAVFTIKFLQVYFHTNWMVFLGFLTFLAAIQIHFKATCLIYLTGSASFLIFLLLPVCLAAILVIIISRFIPFVQSRGMLTVIGLLTGSILLSAIRVMQPERLISAEGKMRLVTFVQNLYKPWMTALPSEWVTNILFAQAQNNLKGIVANFLSLFLVALVLLVITYVTANFFYKKVWSDAAVMSAAVHNGRGWQIMLKVFPYSLRGFIRKDLLSFSRDTMEKGSLLILVPLSFVYLYSMYVLNRHIQNVNEEQIFSFLYVYLFNLFYASVVIAGLSGRWVLPGVSSEGNNFKLIKKSPASLKDFLRAKLLLGFIPLLLLGQILNLSSSCLLHFEPYLVLVSAFTIGILGWGITLICQIVGMRQADFSIASPLNFALSTKGLLCLTWELVFLITILVLVGISTALFLFSGFSYPFVFALSVSIFVTLMIFMVLYRLYKSSIVLLSNREV